MSTVNDCYSFDDDQNLPQYLKDARRKRKHKFARINRIRKRAETQSKIIPTIIILIGLWGVFVPGAMLGFSKILGFAMILFGIIDLQDGLDVICKECGAKHHGHKLGCPKGKV